MPNLPAILPDLLRAAGLRVAEVPGWHNRGRPASTGGFDPVGVLCHHTATSRRTSDAAVVDLLVRGRSDLPGPLAQLGLARDGTVYLIAAGRANHAGRAKSSGSVAAGDGNRLYIGIEAFNDGVGESWPAEQYGAYVLLAAALCKHVTGNSVRTVRGHKETSVTGKIDPRFDMDAFRVRVQAVLDAPTPDHRPPEDDMPAPADWTDKDWAAFRRNLAVEVPGQDRSVDLPTALHWTWHHAALSNVDVKALAAELAKRVGPNATAEQIVAEFFRQTTPPTEEDA